MKKDLSYLYGQFCRIYELNGDIQIAQIKIADPATGGNEMLAHNWGNEESRQVIEDRRARMEKARAIFNAMYNKTFANTYPGHSASKRYLKTGQPIYN